MRQDTIDLNNWARQLEEWSVGVVSHLTEVTAIEWLARVHPSLDHSLLYMAEEQQNKIFQQCH